MSPICYGLYRHTASNTKFPFVFCITAYVRISPFYRYFFFHLLSLDLVLRDQKKADPYTAPQKIGGVPIKKGAISRAGVNRASPSPHKYLGNIIPEFERKDGEKSIRRGRVGGNG